MKKVLYLISVIAATTMFVTGCNENEDKNEKATLQAFAKTGCKSSSSATRNGGEGVFFPETIRYEATADGCLLVNHVNAMFSCEAQITGSVLVEGNEIRILEDFTDSGLNCICPYDLTMKIGPLKNGTYKLKLYIHNFQNEHTSFTFDYSQSVKGEWTVE